METILLFEVEGYINGMESFVRVHRVLDGMQDDES
jgi:hypothetical protein